MYPPVEWCSTVEEGVHHCVREGTWPLSIMEVYGVWMLQPIHRAVLGGLRSPFSATAPTVPLNARAACAVHRPITGMQKTTCWCTTERVRVY